MKPLAAIFALAILASGHRLDEYLQATTISIDEDRLQAEVRLTPGVAVFPAILAGIDSNADGIISEAEQDAYAGHVLGDLSLTLDGRPLKPRLISKTFPAIDEMKEGRGEIRIQFDAALPRAPSNHSLTFENHHRSEIAAYLVNALVPSDPGIRLIAQHRNYSQSCYQLDYARAGADSGPLTASEWSWLAAVAMVWSLRLLLLRRNANAIPA
jgi:hypothetical protein